MKITKRQLRKVIREALEQVDWDNPQGSWDSNDQENWENEQEQAEKNSGERPEIEPRMLEAFIDKMLLEDMTPAEFMNYFGNQDGYAYHGAHWERLRDEYLYAMEKWG